jgi:MSHA pilin protein MshC
LSKKAVLLLWGGLFFYNQCYLSSLTTISIRLFGHLSNKLSPYLISAIIPFAVSLRLLISRVFTMDRKGFTLIELVMVLVLIGIVAIVVVPRLPNVAATKAGALVDKLRADIRYAQNLAMTRNTRSRVRFNGNGTAPPSGYTVVTSTTSTCTSFIAATDPARGGALTVTLGTGDYANISVVPGKNCLEYDSLGRPCDCSASGTMLPGSSCFTSISSALTVTINAGSVAAGSITISLQTGAVN